MSSSSINNSTSGNHYEAGTLFTVNNDSMPVRLYKIPFDALMHIKDEEIYQHHLMTENFIELQKTEGEHTQHLFLLHFFKSPKYVQYYPSETRVEVNWSQSIPYCVAYFLYDKSIWATNMYSSLDSFNKDFAPVIDNA